MTNREIENVLDKFKQGKRYRLKNHPSIDLLRARIDNSKFYLDVLEKICHDSSEEYFLVYEHGDFAPWNLISTESGIIPFDFEYFEEIGLEYMDSIKYHFQTALLLKDYKGKKLVKYIKSEIDLVEFKLLLCVFLLKQIVIKTEENNSFYLEDKLLNLIWSEKV